MISIVIDLFKSLLLLCIGLGFINGSLLILHYYLLGFYEDTPKSIAHTICIVTFLIGLLFIIGAFT